MYSSRKKSQEDVPMEITSVWICSSEDCNGWMRDNFTFSDEPTCPQCKSAMVKGEKKIAVLANTSPVQSSKG
ncbi:cold-shock protein [Paenibacillus alvei]|uniref:cold-shock protein n=1 Tax=Paenibacillus alvei TaxID=44250 RepID=UPI0010FD9294|nr:cold-shock protein [Paenibacillus alvei]